MYRTSSAGERMARGRDHEVRVLSAVCPGDGARGPIRLPGPALWGLCLVRRGCFRYRSARVDALIDPTVGLFEAPGGDFDVEHPVPGGDLDTFVVLSAEALAAVAGDELALPVVVRTTPWVDWAHRRLVVLADREPFGWAVQELGLTVAAALLARVQPHRMANGWLHTERAGRDVVDHARAALTSNSDLTLVQLAALVGCSPQQLSRSFVRHTGVGVAAYRIALRTGQVLDKLADGQGSLADLAAVCGFADHAHLSRTVRRRFGSTPSTLRAALTDDPGRHRQNRRGDGTDVQAMRRAGGPQFEWPE